MAPRTMSSKRRFASFSAESSARDIVALREEILKNPAALSQRLPNSKMVEIGEGAVTQGGMGRLHLRQGAHQITV